MPEGVTLSLAQAWFLMAGVGVLIVWVIVLTVWFCRVSVQRDRYLERLAQIREELRDDPVDLFSLLEIVLLTDPS